MIQREGGKLYMLAPGTNQPNRTSKELINTHCKIIDAIRYPNQDENEKNGY
jgi:hypothetical protein